MCIISTRFIRIENLFFILNLTEHEKGIENMISAPFFLTPPLFFTTFRLMWWDIRIKSKFIAAFTSSSSF